MLLVFVKTLNSRLIPGHSSLVRLRDRSWSPQGTKLSNLVCCPAQRRTSASEQRSRKAERRRADSSGQGADVHVHHKVKGRSLQDSNWKVLARSQKFTKRLNLPHIHKASQTKWTNSLPEVSSIPGDSPLDLEHLLNQGNKGVKGC